MLDFFIYFIFSICFPIPPVWGWPYRAGYPSLLKISIEISQGTLASPMEDLPVEPPPVLLRSLQRSPLLGAQEKGMVGKTAALTQSGYEKVRVHPALRAA